MLQENVAYCSKVQLQQNVSYVTNDTENDEYVAIYKATCMYKCDILIMPIELKFMIMRKNKLMWSYNKMMPTAHKYSYSKVCPTLLTTLKMMSM